jgi:hypothetical protein
VASHKVYVAIVKAIEQGKLEELFSSKDFKNACPGFGEGTYSAFLWKHRKGNLEDESELFELLKPNTFRLIRPMKYEVRNGNRSRYQTNRFL